MRRSVRRRIEQRKSLWFGAIVSLALILMVRLILGPPQRCAVGDVRTLILGGSTLEACLELMREDPSRRTALVASVPAVFREQFFHGMRAFVKASIASGSTARALEAATWLRRVDGRNPETLLYYARAKLAVTPRADRRELFGAVLAVDPHNAEAFSCLLEASLDEPVRLMALVVQCCEQVVEPDGVLVPIAERLEAQGSLSGAQSIYLCLRSAVEVTPFIDARLAGLGLSHSEETIGK